MAEYIERKKAIEEIEKYVVDAYDVDLYDYEHWDNGVVKYILEGLYEAVERLDEVPAADVDEVRHGEWIITEYPLHFDVECSACKTSFYIHKKGQYRIDHSSFCPECGATMGLRNNDER